MNTGTRNALNAYNKVAIEDMVEGADPQKLILMLFDGAVLAIRSAKQHLLHSETSLKGVAISKAIAIVDSGLKASLDTDTGGELAQKLHSLYDYIIGRLLVANSKNDTAILDEVSQLLDELRGAWASIGTPSISSNAATRDQSPPADRPTISYGKV